MAVDLTDATSNSNDLTNSGVAEWSGTKPFVGSLGGGDFDDSESDYASITDASQTGLDITGDMTVEAWIRLRTLPSTAGTNMTIMSKDNVGVARGYGLLLQSSDDKLLFATFGTGSTSTRFTMDTAFDSDDLNTWIHVAASIDVSASTIAFYKNGSSAAGTQVAATATDILDTAAPFIVGARQSSGSEEAFFDGQLTEVRVWNDIRTSGEISSNYDSALIGNEAGLQAYYQMEVPTTSFVPKIMLPV